MTKDTGGPAFPCVHELSETKGMTLRDWFAGQALVGMCATAPQTMRAIGVRAKKQGVTEEELVARYAFVMADAMLAERSKP